MKMTSTPKLEPCKNVRCIIYYLKKLLMTPNLDRHSTTDPKPEMLRDERNVCGIEHAHMFRKNDFLKNDD